MYYLDCMAQLDIFSKTTKKKLKDWGKCGDLSSLKEDEYFNFSLYLKNNDVLPFCWKEAYVRVDGGNIWRWKAGQIRPGSRCVFPIAYHNVLTCAVAGTHEVIWYFDGKEVHREYFHLTCSMNWKKVFPIPTEEQIKAYRNPYQRRSPYLCGWLNIPKTMRYTEYMVDFRVGHLPKGTYVSLGNWKMDHSSLKKQYKSIKMYVDATHAYAGFQRIADGSTTAIMSFWDIECTDRSGNTRKLCSSRLYPEQVLKGGRFGGEGEGARSNVPFSWEAGHWYRMHLKAISSKERKGTIVEQWVCDLETDTYTLLTRFLVPIENSAFIGNIGIFLENFLPETAGEVRSMEVCNPKYLRESTGKWCSVTDVFLASNGGVPRYEGSYNFGIIDDRIYMITSGVGGDWFGNGKGKKMGQFSLTPKR